MRLLYSFLLAGLVSTLLSPSETHTYMKEDRFDIERFHTIKSFWNKKKEREQKKKSGGFHTIKSFWNHDFPFK